MSPMQIILMRHGRPLGPAPRWLSARAFGAWVDAYDAAPIDPACPPPAAALRLARQAAWVQCSSLPRSLSSAAALGVRPDAGDVAFRELDLPRADWRFPPLPVACWLLLFRLAWVAGYRRQAESFAAARDRAAACAAGLIQLAGQQGSVLFVGHGALNWFIGRALRRAGWQSSGGARRYWEAAVFSRGEPVSPEHAG